MTIAPLNTPYNGYTHVRVLRLEFETAPGTAYFHLGKFNGDEPVMPWQDVVLPANWEERTERNTASLPVETTTLEEVLTAIETELANHS